MSETHKPDAQHVSSASSGPATAIVTGAASNIGRVTALALLARGWKVAALDIDQEGLRTLRAEAESRDLQTIHCDLASEDSIIKAVAQAGFESLTLLVNNGGPADPGSPDLANMSLADWHQWIDPHLTGAFLMSRECLPALRAAGGSIVNMVSTRAYMSEADTYGYAAAKGGMMALTHAMAVGQGPAVRVNGIAPGWISPDHSGLSQTDHDQHPVGRVGRPEDIAEAVIYLASAGFVTGQVLVVDGGMMRKMIYQ